MNPVRLAFINTGLVAPVGLSAPAACAAFRAKLTNPSETRFKGSDGEWLMAHQVALEQPWRGIAKLARMAAMAIEEALEGIPPVEWTRIPLVLCVAEPQRPGRIDGLEDQLFLDIQELLGASFSPHSRIVAHGRVGPAVAMHHARSLIDAGEATRVLVAATDSFVLGATLGYYEREDRLLTAENSNGFMPGEGAGALLVGESQGVAGELVCDGLGFAREAATVALDEPLRGDGLTQAMKAALQDAGWGREGKRFRIADLSGEQYYFKEASLALSRAIPQRKDDWELWHPAECMGEAGAASAMACLVAGHAAAAKGYAPAPEAIVHFSSDEGTRAVVLMREA